MTTICRRIADVTLSLVNSADIILSSDYRDDLIRSSFVAHSEM